jgi:hypothetical protein
MASQFAEKRFPRETGSTGAEKPVTIMNGLRGPEGPLSGFVEFFSKLFSP